MSKVKIFKLANSGRMSIKSTKTLTDPSREDVIEAIDQLKAERGGEWAPMGVAADGTMLYFDLEAPKPVEEKPAKKAKPAKAEVDKTNCAKGHLRADWWRINPAGRSYCRKCAVAASLKSRARRKARDAEAQA